MSKFKVEKDFIVDGYRCVVIGGSMGHRCGYVGLPKEHSLYGKHYNDIDNLDVHGGLTYSGGGTNSKYPVESNLWWLGFDCGHWLDGKDFDLIAELADERTLKVMQEIEKEYPTEGTIRTTEYVENELINLVKQIKEE
jgi:hypothetical protein